MIEERSLQLKPERHKEDLDCSLTKIFTMILDHNGHLHYNELWKILKTICQKALATFATFSFHQDVLSFLNRHPTVFSVLNNEVHVLQDSIHVPNISSNDGKIIAVMTVFFEVVKVVDREKLVQQLQEFWESINKYQANLSSSQKFQFFQKNPSFMISSDGVVQSMFMFNSSVECVTAGLSEIAESCVTAMLKAEVQKSGKIHCVAAMDVLKRASKKISIFFSNFSVPEKYWFFKNRPNHFHVSNSGYVQLTVDVEEKVINFLLREFQKCDKIHCLELIKHLKNAPSDISDFFDDFSGPQRLQFFRNHPEKFLVGANSYVYIPGEIMKNVYDKEAGVYSPADVGKVVGDVFSIILKHNNNRLQHNELWKLLNRICDEAMKFCRLPSSEILSFLTKNYSFFRVKDGKVSLTMSDSDCGPNIRTSKGKVISLLRFLLQNYDVIHYEVLATSFRNLCLDVKRFHCANASNSKKFFKVSPVFNISRDGHVTVIHESESQVIDFFISKLQQWGKLHHLKLIKILKDSSLPISNFFDSYSDSQKFFFFKDRLDKFMFGSDGYVSLKNVVATLSVKQTQSPTPISDHHDQAMIVNGKSGPVECFATAGSLVQMDKHSESTTKISAIGNAIHSTSPSCCVSQENDGGSKKSKSAIAKFFLSVLQEHGKLHYWDLIEALRSSSMCNSDFFDKLSEFERTEFFKRRSDRFNIDRDGYVKACEVELSEAMGNTQQSSQNQNDLPGKAVASDKESESKVVDFLLLKLEQHGKVHYSELIQTLKDSSSNMPAFFCEYSMPQNLQFFIERPDIFTVDNNGYVQAVSSLVGTAFAEQAKVSDLAQALSPPSSIHMCYKNMLPKKTKSELKEFILSKLEEHGKLHHLELIEMWQDTSFDHPDFFDSYAKSEKMEFFKQRSNLFDIDHDGYVQMHVDMGKSNNTHETEKDGSLQQSLPKDGSEGLVKSITVDGGLQERVIDVLLAQLQKHGKMHISELVQISKNSSSDISEFFGGSSDSMVIEFFKGRSDIFVVDSCGFVRAFGDAKSMPSSEHRENHQAQRSVVKGNQVKSKIAKFLLSKLQENGRMRYSELIKMLEDSSLDHSDYFDSCSEFERIEFFKRRSDRFLVHPSGHLEACKDATDSTLTTIQTEVVNESKESVPVSADLEEFTVLNQEKENEVITFLLPQLEKYDKLHYSKLVQLLKDSSVDIEDFFGSFESGKYFKKQPEKFDIDSKGYVSVCEEFKKSLQAEQCSVLPAAKHSACTNEKIDHTCFDEGAEAKVVKFMLSHLLAHGKVHFLKLIQALENSSLDFSNFFERHTPSGKFRFFKDKPNIFIVDNGSYVTAVRRSETVNHESQNPSVKREGHSMTVNKEEERKVIEFSLLQLECLGRMHYLKLIELVKNSSSDISDYFDVLTGPEKYRFFKRRPDKFDTNSDGYVKAHKSASNSQNIGQCDFSDHPEPSGSTNAIHLEMNGRSEDKVVEFLLSQLRNHGKTHYLKLTKVLQNASSAVSDYFDRYSDAEMFKFFKDRPGKFSILTDGYVEARVGLQNVKANIVTEPAVHLESSVLSKNHQETSEGSPVPVSRNEKKVIDCLLSVLGDERRHYCQLIYMAMNKSLTVSLFFENYSAPEELEFFQKHPDQFHVDADGYVRATEKKRNASPLSSSITSPVPDSGVNTHSEDSASCSWTDIEESSTIVENHNIIRNSSYEYSSSSVLQSPIVKDIRKPFISSELYKKLKEIIKNKRNEQHPNYSFEEIKFSETESNKTGVRSPSELSSAETCDLSAKGFCDDGIVNLFSCHLQAFGKMHYRKLFVVLEDCALFLGMEHERMQSDEQLKFFDRHSGIFHVDGDGHVSLVMPKEGTKVVTACVGEEKESPFPFLCCKKLKHKIGCRYVKQLSDVHIMSVQHLVDVLKSDNELTVEELVKKACDADEYVKQFFSNFSKMDFALFFEIHSMFFSHNNEGKIVLTNAADDHSRALMSGAELLHAVHANIVILLYLCVNVLKSVTKFRYNDLERVLESAPAFVLSFLFTNYPGDMFSFPFIKDYSEYFFVDDDGFVSLNGDACTELIEHWVLALFPSSISLLSELKQKLVFKFFDSVKVGSNIPSEEFSSIKMSDQGISICEPVDANLSSDTSSLTGINFESAVGERFSYVNGTPTECNEISAPVYKNECLLMNDFSKASSFENRSMNIESDASSYGNSTKAGSIHNDMCMSPMQGLKQQPVHPELSTENVSNWLNSSEPPSKLHFQNFTEESSSVPLSEIEKRAIKFFRKVLAKRRVPVSLSDLQLIVCAAPDDVSDYLAIQFRDLHTFFQKHQNIFRSTTQTFISLEITEENIL